PRARQNVIFELGFFLGRLGPKKVCALFSGNLEKPSDFEAVVYIPYSSNSDWKSALARELNHAEVAFDHSKVFL
ncbi:nucleotide-binding protein, partial [Escherichia coli]|nr:nucleotide-binding protein [Escherichia coli]